MKPLLLLTPFLVGLYSVIVEPLAESDRTPGAFLHSSTRVVDFGESHPNDQQSSDSIRLKLAGPRGQVQVTGVRFHGPSADRFSVHSIPPPIIHGGETELKVSFDPDNHPGPVDATMEITTDSPDTPSLRVELKARIMPAST